MLRYALALRRHPSALLLGVQLLGLLLYPLMEDTASGRALFGAFGIVVLGLALWVVNRSPAVLWIAWCLAVPSVVLSIAAAMRDSAALGTFAQSLESLLYFYTAASLIAYISRFTALSPGDLIATGTPGGVGFARVPPIFMKEGDRVVGHASCLAERVKAGADKS